MYNIRCRCGHFACLLLNDVVIDSGFDHLDDIISFLQTINLFVRIHLHQNCRYISRGCNKASIISLYMEAQSGPQTLPTLKQNFKKGLWTRLNLILMIEVVTNHHHHLLVQILHRNYTSRLEMKQLLQSHNFLPCRDYSLFERLYLIVLLELLKQKTNHLSSAGNQDCSSETPESIRIQLYSDPGIRLPTHAVSRTATY